MMLPLKSFVVTRNGYPEIQKFIAEYVTKYHGPILATIVEENWETHASVERDIGDSRDLKPKDYFTSLTRLTSGEKLE